MTAPTAGRAALPPRFDPSDPAIRADPYPVYAALRSAAPVCRGGPAQLVVTRYHDVAALLRDPRLGNEFPEEYHVFSAGDGEASEFLRRIVLHRDPPAHTRLRRLMGQAFSPSLVRAMRARIAELVAEILAPALDRGQFDAVADLAFPLPVHVVCELTGIPSADRDEVRPRAFDLGLAFSMNVPPADRARANAAVTWLRRYIAELLKERQRVPGDDLLSQMVVAQEHGERLTHDEIVDNVVFLFFAGFETTMNMLATGCAALMDHPGELARLRADPSLAQTASDEFLRFDAPIQSRIRLVLAPVEVGGRTIRPGRVLFLLLGSANRDERQFADPDRLDIGRRPNRHLSFGGGIHHCLGAALARIEGEVVLEHFVRRFARLEPAGPPVRQVDSAFRGYASVPIALTPA